MGEGLAVRNEDRAQNWFQVIQECRDSGLTNREFCRQRGIPEKKFYYWLRKLRTQARRHWRRHSHRLCQYRRALSQRMCSKFIFEARICGFPER